MLSRIDARSVCLTKSSENDSESKNSLFNSSSKSSSSLTEKHTRTRNEDGAIEKQKVRKELRGKELINDELATNRKTVSQLKSPIDRTVVANFQDQRSICEIEATYSFHDGKKKYVGIYSHITEVW